jgi:Icc-related predicted phosphoesterase
MKLYITSDWHFEVSEYRTFPHELPAFDVAVVAGDVDRGIARSVRRLAELTVLAGKPVIFVPGNHEFDGAIYQDVLADGLLAAEASPNIHVLHRAAAVIAGVRFIGATLWTDYALYRTTKPSMVLAGQTMPDHKVIRYRETGGHISRFMPWHVRAEHMRDRTFIEDALRQPHEGATVVVTHHLPSPRSIFRMFQGHPLSPAFASDLEPLIERYKPALWVHGHAHHSNDYRLSSTRIVANPKGYGPHPKRLNSENPLFEEKMIVEI